MKLEEIDVVNIRAWAVGYAIDTHKAGTAPETILKTAAKYHRYIMNEPKCKVKSIKGGKHGKS